LDIYMDIIKDFFDTSYMNVSQQFNGFIKVSFTYQYGATLTC